MIKKNSDIVELTQFYIVISAICTVIAFFFSSKNSFETFVASQLVVFFLFCLIGLSVYLLFLKKNIALFTCIIVFKWPILIYGTYQLTKHIDLSPVFFALGLLPVILSSLVWAINKKE